METRVPLQDRTNCTKFLAHIVGKETAENITLKETNVQKKRRDSDEVFRTAHEWEIAEDCEDVFTDKCAVTLQVAIENDEKVESNPQEPKQNVCPGPRHHSTPTLRENKEKDLNVSNCFTDYGRATQTPTCKKKVSFTTSNEIKNQLFEEGKENQPSNDAEKEDSKLEVSKISIGNLNVGFMEDKSLQKSRVSTSIINEFDVIPRSANESIQDGNKEEYEDELDAEKTVICSESYTEQQPIELLVDLSTNVQKNTFNFVPLLQFDSLNKELQQRDKEIEALQLALRESESQISEHTSDMKLRTKEVQVLQTAVCEYETRVSKLVGEIEERDRVVQNLQKALNISETRIINLTDEMDRICEINRLQTEAVMAEKDDKLKELAQRIEKIQLFLVDYQNKEKEYSEKEAELIKVLEIKLAEVINERDKALSSLEMAETSFSETYAKYQRSKSLLDKYKEQLESLNSQTNKAAEVNQLLSDRHKKLKEEARKEINLMKNAHEKEITAMNSRIYKLHGVINEFEEVFNKNRNKINDAAGIRIGESSRGNEVLKATPIVNVRSVETQMTPIPEE